MPSDSNSPRRRWLLPRSRGVSAVETPFLFTDVVGAVHRLDPEGPAEALAPALVARHQQLIDGDIWANGRIRMAFSNNSVLEVAPDERYEAWALASDSVSGAPHLLVCAPGGGPVDWSR
jgi:Family of unknown function (DUF6188)